MAYTQQTFADGQVLTAAQLNQMAAGIAGKVDAVAGKGLSANDFTNEEKQKLAGLAEGLDGATYTPAVSAEGVISWTNDKGKANPSPVNIRGPKGADGAPLTVVSVEGSSEDGGENVIVLSDGTQLIVLNGSKGSTGGAGPRGPSGMDGKNGGDGKDGNGIKSVVLNADYTLTLTFDDGTTYTTPSIRGAAGKDGVSVKHSWNGTTLTITSASGTSSANLKGEKGDTGATGPQGPQGDKGDKGDTGSAGATGPAGYTPARGTDYWTADDIAEIQAYINTAVGNAGSQGGNSGSSGQLSVVTTTGDGNSYAATVPGIAALTRGAHFIMIPNANSRKTAPKLNVNGLGEKTLRMLKPVNSTMTASPSNVDWLRGNYPVFVMFDGTYWVVSDLSYIDAEAFRGSLTIAKGGTGATTAAGAAANLSAVQYVAQSLTDEQKAQARENIGVVGTGEDGSDGMSPTISVAEIDGGHRLTIVDVNGAKTVDVMDGKNGKDGSGGGEAETYEMIIRCAPTASEGVDAYVFADAYIDGSNGSIVVGAPGYYVSKAYPIMDGCVVSYKGRGVSAHSIVAFYDADGAFISGVSTTAGGLSTIEGTAEIPQGARAVVFGTNGTDAYGQITYTTSGEMSVKETTYSPNGTGMIKPGYWDASGVFQATGGYYSTEQIATDASYITVTVNGRTYSSIGHVCFYDANKALISAKPLVQITTDNNAWMTPAPVGTRYYAITLYQTSSNFAIVAEYTVDAASGGSGGEGVNTAELAEKLTSVEEKVDHLYSETLEKNYAAITSEAVSSAFIDTNGAEAATSTFKASGFVEVNEACTIDYLLYGSTSTAMIAFYDEHQDFISGIVPTSSGLHTDSGVIPPDNAHYVRYAVIVSGSGCETQFVRITRRRIDSLYIENARRKASDPLYGKVLTATGDSITATVSNRPYASYARMIAADNSMTYETKAIWGATLASGIQGSSGCILNTLANMRADADYVILSGGANDFYYLASGAEKLGAVTTGYAATLDTTTFCGAVESLCKTAINKWVGKKILYVITHRMLDVSEQTTSQAVSILKQILEKWGIPYVDLWHDMPSLMFDSLKNLYTSNGNTVYSGVGDGLHPNEEGYRRYYVPRVEAKLLAI